MTSEVDRQPRQVESTRPRMHELDGLRGVAIALVLANHGAVGAVREVLADRGLGWPADVLYFLTASSLNLFFVLSGVVLLRPFLRRERPFRTRTYLRRRLERLWPPYAVALMVAGLVMALAWVYPTWYSREILPPFSATDWLFQVGIVNLGWESYSGAWWSLNLEVFFYLLVPLLVLALVAVRRSVAAFVAMVAGSVAVSVVAASLSDYAAAFLLPGERTAYASPGLSELAPVFLVFAPCFTLGTAIARFRLSARAGLVTVAYGTVHSLVALDHPALNVHLGLGLLAAGVVVVAMEGAGRLKAWLSTPFLVWLGERSYSLFLIHFPAFYLANYLVSLVLPARGAVYFLLSRAIGIPLALLAAMAMFSMVEARFARGLTTADRFWPWRGASLA